MSYGVAEDHSSTEAARAYRVPFHSVGGMILLDATVNGKPAALLLGTGANQSIVSLDVAGVRAKLDALKSNVVEVGASGLSVNVKIDLRLEKRHWLERPIVAMNLSDASKRLGAQTDGFIGQDVLREFSRPARSLLESREEAAC